jgi:hypothetical protein
MAGHIEVVKLVSEIAVVADAGEEVQEELGGAEGEQDAEGERRKRFLVRPFAGVRLEHFTLD